jgi:hypothetical protein
MSRVSLLGLLVVSSVVGGACSESSSSSSGATGLVVTDTLGKAFSVSCTGSFCTLTPTDPNLTPRSCDIEYGSTDSFVLVYWYKILRVNAVQVPASGYTSRNPAEAGHPIACTTDADCVPGLFSPGFTCQYGLCQDMSPTAPPLAIEDVITLCQADIPWPASCPYLTDPMFSYRMTEVAALCGSDLTCAKVPADCRQPTPPVSPPDGSASPIPTPIDGGAGPAGGAVDSGI